MNRLLRLLVILWHFTAIPSLCQSGVLGHLCPEDASAVCSHEEGCSADPCSYSDETLSKETLRDESTLDAAVAFSATGSFAGPTTEPPSFFNSFLRAHALSRAPQRALPLRI